MARASCERSTPGLVARAADLAAARDGPKGGDGPRNHRGAAGRSRRSRRSARRRRRRSTKRSVSARQVPVRRSSRQAARSSRTSPSLLAADGIVDSHDSRSVATQRTPKSSSKVPGRAREGALGVALAGPARTARGWPSLRAVSAVGPGSHYRPRGAQNRPRSARVPRGARCSSRERQPARDGWPPATSEASTGGGAPTDPPRARRGGAPASSTGSARPGDTERPRRTTRREPSRGRASCRARDCTRRRAARSSRSSGRDGVAREGPPAMERLVERDAEAELDPSARSCPVRGELLGRHVGGGVPICTPVCTSELEIEVSPPELCGLTDRAAARGQRRHRRRRGRRGAHVPAASGRSVRPPRRRRPGARGRSP